MADVKPLRVSETDMLKARRKMKRRIASVLISAMADTDADFEYIGKRLQRPPKKIKEWLYGLIEGCSSNMDEISDLALAMGCEIIFGVQRYAEPVRPVYEQNENPVPDEIAARGTQQT